MSATTVPGEGLPIAVPALLVVLAAASATVAVALIVPALDAGSNGGASGRSQPAARATAESEPRATVAPTASLEAEVGRAPEPSASLAMGAPPPPVSSSAQAPPEPRCAPIRVAFGNGQAAPSPQVATRMRELGVILREQPGATVVIDGHADSLGSDELNLRLSKSRAEALAGVLHSVGIEPKRITSRGFGAFSPIEGTQEDADVNRRAVIHVRGACPRGFTEVLGP